MPGSVIDELDPIAATIEAVLANASALGTCVEAPKKIKRVKKQDQDGCADASTAAEDGEDHKDDSSTTGNAWRFWERTRFSLCGVVFYN